MYEVCDYTHVDGSVCGGMYDPNTNPPIPCIFPEKEAELCILEINNPEPVSI